MAISFDFHDKVIVVHAVIACLVVLGTAPAAILCARYMRDNPRWIKYHRYLNVATILLLTIVFALGTAAVISQADGYQFSGPSRDLHHDMGLGLFVVIVLQGVYGFWVTRKKPGNTSQPKLVLGKSIQRWGHIILGIVLMALLIAESWVGFDEWNSMQSTGTSTPDAVRCIFIVIAGLEVAAYLYHAGVSSLQRISGTESLHPWGEDEVDSKEAIEGESIPMAARYE